MPKFNKILRVTSIALFLTILGGCATTGQPVRPGEEGAGGYIVIGTVCALIAAGLIL